MPTRRAPRRSRTSKGKKNSIKIALIPVSASAFKKLVGRSPLKRKRRAVRRTRKKAWYEL